LSYVLTLQATAPIRVTAMLVFDGTADGTTTLQVEERWASVDHRDARCRIRSTRAAFVL